ncbi:MAG: AEC family transporter [Burkholderiaceae bacterium]|nr:AEC family transporter [Burkholderiaceae bacterium]
MSLVAIVLQPFILIALGFLLSKHRLFPRSLWDGVEVLVYYVVFPPLLFNSVAKATLTVSDTSLFLMGGVASMSLGILWSWLVSKIAPADRATDASIRQCGYRFNSYIGFAIVLALYGETGFALFALLMGVWVPISNAVAVADLAAATQKHGQGFLSLLRSILKNPLILATLAGLFFNVFGLSMPAWIDGVFSSLGSASLALALMAIGAGLKIDDCPAHRLLMGLATVQRLIVVPAVSVWIGRYLGLEAIEIGALLCFTALPTANSCYILAVRMGGNGPAVADLTTLQTLCSLVTIPFWMWVVS